MKYLSVFCLSVSVIKNLKLKFGLFNVFEYEFD